jgi:hypothetical protein
MAKFSGKDRLELALYGPALLGVWWYFVPDYSTFSETPLGQLTFSDIMCPPSGLLRQLGRVE